MWMFDLCLLNTGGSAGHPSLPLPGEGPEDSSACPYCVYYNQTSSSENADEDQQHGCCNSCNSHGNDPCHCNNTFCGHAQASELKKRLWEFCWTRLRSKLELIVGSRYFSRGIMIAILINTLSMGIEYHEQVGLISACLCVDLDGKLLDWMWPWRDWRANHRVWERQQTYPPINTYSCKHMGSQRARVWDHSWVCAGMFQEMVGETHKTSSVN